MLEEGRTAAERERYFALYMRYQTTNKRAFSKCLHDLLKLRAARLKEQQAVLDEARKQQTHAARLRTVDARAALLTLQAERKRRTENHSAQPNEQPIPFAAAQSKPHNAGGGSIKVARGLIKVDETHRRRCG